MDTFEELGAALGTAEVDTEALLARSLRAGRRRQRHRRVVAGAGVLAVGALVAVGAGAHQAGSVAVDPSVTTQPTSHPTRPHTSASPTSDNGPQDVPSASLTDQRLAARLPVAGDPVSAEDLHDTVIVGRSLDPDGAGTGSVSLALSAQRPLDESQISHGADKCRLVSHLHGSEHCRTVDGGWLFTFTGHPDIEGASSKALDWSATAVFKDGTSVQLHATNYVDQANPDRPTSVLDLNQIEQLVLDPVWFQPAP